MLTPEARKEYAARNELLHALGFKNYTAYLTSDTWKKIRHRVLLRRPPCRSCGRNTNQVHHAKYTKENLTGVSLDGLVAVCSHCHKNAEYSKKGNKVGPTQATQKLTAMSNKRSKKVKWAAFFAVVGELRQYVGLDSSGEAQELCARFDLIQEALPPAPKKGKR